MTDLADDRESLERRVAPRSSDSENTVAVRSTFTT
jgi:hypothetical protein